MRREEITRAFQVAEEELPIHAVEWHGVNLWPLLRVDWAFRLHGAAPGGDGPRPSKARAKVTRWTGQVIDFAQRSFHRGPAETVFLSPANRTLAVGGRWVHPLGEPLAGAYRQARRPFALWTLGPGPWRGATRNIDHSLGRIMQARVERGPRQAEPAWHVTLRAWASEVLGLAQSWRQTEDKFLRVEAAAEFFERELRAVGARALVVDCWYGFRQQGALLAAHRLGLGTADLQHGLQGAGHFAYAGWGAVAGTSYQTFPQQFWVWGKDDAQALSHNNPGRIAPGDVRVVGNLWLNSWRGPSAHFARTVDDARQKLGARRPNESVVLVTLQKGIEFEELLTECLARGPKTVRWLVRLHRQMPDDPSELERRLRKTSARVDVVKATRLPLYALFALCDRHVTGFSTCAVEALAFGVPTLLTHQSGRHAFGRFIEAGVMSLALSSAEVLTQLAAPPADAERCRAAVETTFAATEVDSGVMAGLLR